MTVIKFRRSADRVNALQNIKKHRMKVLIPPIPYSIFFEEAEPDTDVVMFMAPDDGIISRVTLDIGDIILKEGVEKAQITLARYGRDNSVDTEVKDIQLGMNDIECSIPVGRGDKFAMFFSGGTIKQSWIGYVFIVKVRKEYMTKVLMDSGYNVIGIK